MKKITVTMIALCIALVSGATLAKSSRVDVLHKPDTPAERVITISESALPAHCRHGDLAPNGDELAQCGDGDEQIQICHNGFDQEDISLSGLEDYRIDHASHGHDIELGECPPPPAE